MEKRAATAAEKNRLAKTLGLKPTDAEKRTGIATGGACVMDACLREGEWRVIDVRGVKHRVAATNQELGA